MRIRTILTEVTDSEQIANRSLSMELPDTALNPNRRTKGSMWTMDDMPRRRSECFDRERPCPWVRCRHHFIWLIWNKLEDRSNDEIADCITNIEYSCVLDIIDKHREMTLEQVGQLLNITRERVRQLEARAIRKARSPSKKRAPILALLKEMLISA